MSKANENMDKEINEAPAPNDVQDIVDDIDPLDADYEAALVEVNGDENKSDDVGDDANATAEAEKEALDEARSSIDRTENANPDEKSPKEDDSEDKAPESQPMIPKARFDQVLAQRDQFQGNANYLQGVVNTQSQMLNSSANQNLPNADGDKQTANGANEDTSTTPAKDIEAIEAKKVELADKYDEGDLSTKDYEVEKIELDRKIREITDVSNKASNAEADARSAQVAQDQLFNQQVNAAVPDLKTKHPYVDVIDSHPNADGIWAEIHGEATINLTQKGINPNDGTINSRLAFMNESARLADIKGNKDDTLILPTQNGSANGDKGNLSETAQARLDKLNLSQQQPPRTDSIGSGGVQTQDITDSQIENMTDDEIADLPPAVKAKFLAG